MVAEAGDPLNLTGDPRELFKLGDDISLGLFDISKVTVKEAGNPVRARLTRVNDGLNEIRRQVFAKIAPSTGLRAGVGKRRKLPERRCREKKNTRSEGLSDPRKKSGEERFQVGPIEQGRIIPQIAAVSTTTTARLRSVTVSWKKPPLPPPRLSRFAPAMPRSRRTSARAG